MQQLGGEMRRENRKVDHMPDDDDCGIERKEYPRRPFDFESAHPSMSVLSCESAQRHDIVGDHSLIPAAIEEVLLLEAPSPVQGRSRRARTAIVVGSDARTRRMCRATRRAP